MKHRVTCLFLCLCLLLAIPLPVNAVFYDEQGPLQYVADQADILTDLEQIELEVAVQELSLTSGCDILIAAVSDLDGYSAEEYAVMLNSENWWNSEDAILFLISMEEREWYIATFGEAIYIFTDYGIDMLGESVVPYLSEGSYGEGFSVYLSMLPDYFSAWSEGSPIDHIEYNPSIRDEVINHSPVREKTFVSVLPASFLVGLVVAAISLLIMRSSMNTKRRQRNAADYLKSGSYRLHSHRDIFLYSNLSKTRRQQNTGTHGGHSGGSSIHRSSGGRSHGGRGGKF